MSVGNNNVTATLKLRGQQAFGAGMRGAATSANRLGSGFRSAGMHAKNLAGNLTRVAATAGAFAGVAAVGFGASLLKDSITQASDLNETLSKTENVFRGASKQVIAWSKTSALSFGLSQQGALAAASQYGDFFHQLGFGTKQAAGLSEGLVKTAADLGSFHNVDPSDVLDRIGGALRGEYDSLQQLIPNISAARVEQVAMANAHVKSAKSLTASQKAQAVLSIIQKDGSNAANDFAETSTGLANSQRILSARFADSKASIGKAFLPYAAKATNWLAVKGLPMFERFGKREMPRLTRAFRQVAPYVQRFTRFVAPLFRIFAGSEVDGARKGFDSLQASLKRNSPWLKAFAERMRDGIVKYGPTIAKYLGIFASLNLRGLLTGIGLAIDGIRYLGLGFVAVDKVILSALGHILAGATKAFGWMPGIGPKLKRANKSFKDFAKTANADLDKIKDTLTVRVVAQPVAVEAVAVAAEKDYGRSAAGAKVRNELQAKTKGSDTVLKVGAREIAHATASGQKKNSAWR